MLLAAWLAVTRIYQVDEAQNLYMARVAAAGETDRFFTTAQLWLLGPMGWIARGAPDSATAFLWARLLFLGVFLANTALLAACTGVPLRSGAGLAALAAAATLAPLWDYGFEIRHDNLILLGLLLLWWSVRARTPGPRTYAALGAASALLAFVSFKALAYVLPLSLALLLWPPPGHGSSRARLGLAWLAGAAAAAASARLLYAALGLWQVFLQGFRGYARASGETRFPPWPTLARLLDQTPLLLALLAASLLVLALSFARQGRRALTWEGTLPELALLAGALALLFVNPTPFPYNLVSAVPFAYLAAVRVLRTVGPWLPRSPGAILLGAGAVLLGHVGPFAVATSRHLRWTNERQVRLMAAAEALTDAARDPVYDGVGMVVSRPSVHFNWYLHSLNIRSFTDGSLPTVRAMLSERPAAVVVRSYRTDWLPQEDRAFLRDRYLPLSDELWVLGARLPPGGGRFEVLHAGRYRVLEADRGQGRVPEEATLDGLPLGPGAQALPVGVHEVRLRAGGEVLVAWVGPRLDMPPALGEAEHGRLFVNWY